MSFWSRLFDGKSAPLMAVKSTPVTVTAEPTVVQSFRYFGAPWDAYGHIYERQPAVRTVVDFLAKNVAQLKPKVYYRDGESRVETPAHELAVLLQHPNESTTPFRHWRDTVADIGIYDRAFWLKLRAKGRVRFVQRVAPSRIVLEFDQQTQRRIYRLSDGVVIPREDLVIFSGYHPDGSEDGVSPLETLRRVLAEEWAATNHRENFWRNAARQAGTIERPLEAPEWPDTARQRFRSDWQSTMAGGANAGKTAVLEEGMHWNPSAFSPEASQYIEGRRLTFEEVARAYAPSLVGLMSNDTRSGIESFHRQLYQDALAPLTRSLEDEIELQLLPDFEFNEARRFFYVEFNLAEKLRGSFEEQARALVTAVGVPYLGVNEARAMLNKPRIDDTALDEPVKPMNVMYGNQPAVTVPTEDPGTQLRSYDLSAKLEEFFERQETSIVRLLGAVGDHGSMSVMTAWDAKRWNRELAKLFLKDMPFDDAERTADWLNTSHRDQIASSFAVGGLDAVRAVFAEAKAASAEHAVLRIRQPELSVT